MRCGDVLVDGGRCLRAAVATVTGEILRGHAVFTESALERNTVVGRFGRVISHSFDCNPFCGFSSR